MKGVNLQISQPTCHDMMQEKFSRPFRPLVAQHVDRILQEVGCK